jgi:hypothetical protein
MRYLLILILLSVSGCAVRRPVLPQQVQNMTVEFEDEVSGAEEGFALFCVDYILNKWAADFGIQIKPATIRISRQFRVFWGGEDVPFPPWSDDPWFTLRTAGKAALGFYIHRGGQDLIYLTAGRWSSLPALYHEICHLMLAPRDVDHENPGWDTWQDRQYELQDELLSEWFEWDSDGRFDKLNEKVEAKVEKARKAVEALKKEVLKRN